MVELSPQLALAQRWAIALGNKVEVGGATSPTGQDVVSLSIEHGPVRLVIVEQNGVLQLICGLGVNDEIAAALSKLSAKIQQEILVLLKHSLMECPRVAWTMVPANLTRIGELKGIQLGELLRISENELQTFNRFADAIQELTTLAVKTQVVFSTAAVGGTSSALSPGADKSPQQIYR